ncbi:4-hydroxy-tetrahydrodipicolinate synthase [Roseateles sp. SL47]|uniref:4-hydroxy-tetrahydrodipicolinate synthase family protein n=1 Tax=Roseateles sp. SL47 TaxID=2995138 RepID=UPI0022715F6E|nr:4-hydroxy-tetrahydrodipicolinate synthase [Roseateles sp. SL47]WAC73463.1 4-hydroxy-tetrahydrodipicolinate synthase [Roseateles sp. SL47]
MSMFTPASHPEATLADPFAGLWVPIVTPFRAGQVDHQALGRLTRHLASAGIAGFVVCGSTGEAAALEPEEAWASLVTVAAHANGLPLMMGVGGEHLGHARARVCEAGRLARTQVPTLRALLVSAPQYVRPSQSGVRGWFESLADSGELPLVLYDIPYRTGVSVHRDTLLALAAHPRIRAIKDCGGDLGKTLAVLADGRLAVLAGEDLQLFSHLAQGAVGAIAASAHLQTARWVQLLKWVQQGHLREARALWAQLVPMIELLFSEPNPGPVKAALAQSGWMAHELRPPMQPVSEALAQRLRALAV